MVKAKRSGGGSKKKQGKNSKKTTTRRGGLIVGGEKVMSSINDEIDENSGASFDKIKKGVDELTTVITNTATSGKKRIKKISKKNNSREIESFNEELLSDLNDINKNTENVSTIIEIETIKIKNKPLKVDVSDIIDSAMVGDIGNIVKIMEKDLNSAYAERLSILSKLNKIFKSLKIVDIDYDDSFEKMMENDKHMLDLNIKELQDTTKITNTIKKTIGGKKTKVSGVNRETNTPDVMNVTVSDVISDNPPASNPEYTELPPPQKSLIVKLAERSKIALVNSSMVLAYISNSNYLLTMLILILEKFLLVIGFQHSLLFVGTGYTICFIIFHIYKSTLKSIQNLRNGLSVMLGYNPIIVGKITYAVKY